MMRVLVTGSRDWATPDHVTMMVDVLRGLPNDATLVINDSKGAATMAEYGWVSRWNNQIEKHNINWNRRGQWYDKAAGYKNSDLLVSLGADVCFAFVVRDSLGNIDNVTRYVMEQALKNGIPVHVYEVGKDVEIIMPSVEVVSVNKLAVAADGTDPWG